MKRSWILSLTLGFVCLAGCEGVGVSYYANTPPPPVRVETFGPSPGSDYFWINGYWGWNNNAYAWVPGRWDRRPRPNARWVEPRWEHRGNRYVFRQGRWR